MSGTTVSEIQRLESRCLLSAGGNSFVDGVAVMGDSYSDEYQFYAPDRSTAHNWVEQLSDDAHVNFGAFSNIDPDGSQNAGFEFNWAVSGATSGDMIAGGQHLGVAQQVASGRADLATLFIGGNDFRHVFEVLATQGLPAALEALEVAVPAAALNIATAAGTVLSPAVVNANPDARLILTTVPKPSRLPEVRALLQSVPQLQPFVDAVDAAAGGLNQAIRDIASTNPRIAVADFYGMVEDLFTVRTLRIANIEINRDAIDNPTNDAAYVILRDRIHPGTVVQAWLANLYVKTANQAFGAHLDELSTHDILENAGLTHAHRVSTRAGTLLSGRFGHTPISPSGATDRDLVSELFSQESIAS